MSFILDALQKDQVEQQQPQPTPVGMLPPSKPSPTKRWGLWLLGLALLVNAGVLVWYLQSQESTPRRVSDVAPSVPGTQRELAMGPASKPTPPQRNDQSSSIPKRTPVRTPDRNPVAAPTREPARNTTSRGSTPKATPAPNPAPKPNTGAGRVLSPEQAAKLGIGNDLLDAQKQASAQTSNTQTATKAPAKSPRASNAITIAELPTAARNSFPELEFSTHIFADDPSMRAVVVNDKRLTEGEQMGELILRAVTEEGVVFGYRKHLVAVSVVDLWAE